MRSRSLGLLVASMMYVPLTVESSAPLASSFHAPLLTPSRTSLVSYTVAPSASPTSYPLTSLANPSLIHHLFDRMRPEVKELDTLAVMGVSIRQRMPDASLDCIVETPAYPGKEAPPSYDATAFTLFYINPRTHPSPFILRLSRNGERIYTNTFNLAEGLQKHGGFLLFDADGLAPADRRIHGCARYTVETLVLDDEDPEGEPRVEQELEFFIEYK